MQDVVFIVNPVAGRSRQRLTVDDRARLIERTTRARRVSARLDVTSRAGEATRLAREAVARGTPLVVAWGGDGTVNEVATALVGSTASFGVIPGGSGNGFARSLELPSDPELAMLTALEGDTRVLDVGEIDGRLFMNVAGIGLDAAVARVFNRTHAGQRGLLGYVKAAIPVLLRYEPLAYSIDWDQPPFTGRAFMVVVANGRQYGNGFMVAPDAEPGDGHLDVVVVRPTSPLRDLGRALRVGLRRSLLDDHVTTGRCGHLTVVSERPMSYHVDGEAFDGGTTLVVRTHAGALRVRCPSAPAASR